MSTGSDSLKKNVCSIPVDIEMRDGDGRSAYALSLQMIFRHVADFHMTVVDIISEKYGIPVDDIMNTVTSDLRYKNMVVDKDLHRLSTVVYPTVVYPTVVYPVNEVEKKKDEQEEQETQLPKPNKPKPIIIKKVGGEKKIKIKPKVKQIKSPTKCLVGSDGVEQCD